MRVQTFTFRLSVDERRMLAALACSLQRSQGDALRLLLRNAANELTADQAQAAQTTRGVREAAQDARHADPSA